MSNQISPLEAANRKLHVTDSIEETSYAPKSYLIYQMLMDSYSLKSILDKDEFSTYILRKLEVLKGKILTKGEPSSALFYEFHKLGSILWYRQGKEAEAVFFELKSRRDRWLKDQKSLHSFLIIEKSIETEGVYNNNVSIIIDGYTLHEMEKRSTILIELKEQINQEQVNEFIKEYFESKMYSAYKKGNYLVAMKDETDEMSVISTTSIKKDSGKNTCILISVNDL